MTKNISEEELLLRKRARRRLVGAIVLVIFSVVVLPIIFDDPKPDDEQREIAINLPTPSKGRSVNTLSTKDESTKLEAPDSAGLLSDIEGKSGAELKNNEENLESLDDRKRIPIPGIKPRIDHKHPGEVKVVTAAPVNTAGTTSTTNNPVATTDASKGFVIQLGAFSDQVKAKQQVDNLISNGFKAFTETLKTGNTEVTRVRIGSFANRNSAEIELKKLKKLGFDGVITSK